MGWLPDVETVSPTKDGGRQLNSYAPASGELLGHAPIYGDQAVAEAVARARAAQVEWAAQPLARRCEAVLALRDGIVSRAEDLVEVVSRECGKPPQEALVHEVMVVADLATFFARQAPRMLAPRDIELHLLRHRRSYVHYVPRGVVGIISPWNFPLTIPIGDALCALLAGNAVVLKPSEVTPLVALKFKQIFDKSPLENDLFQVVTGDGGTGAALVEAKPDKVVFTGAVATGRRVAAACGERLIPCTMELGGKAAAIVCDDVDIDRTARAVVFGAFANSGQICISIERVYVHERVYEEFLDRVLHHTAALRQGDPAAEEVDVGAMTFPRQVEIVQAHLEDALGKGATLRRGGELGRGPGQFFAPTVLTECTHDMTVMREEIFGPLLPITSVRDEEEALRCANDSHLGLMGYVFTRDRARGRALAEQVRAGTVMVNDVLSAYGTPEAPFGGVKDSGFGRVHGEEGLRDMCEIRHVSYGRLQLPAEPFWFPYSRLKHRALLRTLRILFGGGSPVKRLLDML